MLDQAYLKLTRWDWFTASGGRFPNPTSWARSGLYIGDCRTPPHTIPMAGVVHTDLLWDVDLNFEGVALNIHPWIRENRTVKPFFNAGIYPLQQINQSETVKAKDKWFYGVQAGMEWAPEDSDMKVRFGAAYYDFRNIAGVRNPNFGDTLYNQSAPYSGKKATAFSISTTMAIRPPISGRWRPITGLQTPRWWRITSNLNLSTLSAPWTTCATWATTKTRYLSGPDK